VNGPSHLPDGWHPDVEVDEHLVRRLLADLPHDLLHLRDLPLHFVAEGWDNSIWRVGPDLAARVPRRPLAAPLLRHEARWSNQATSPLVDHGLAVPRVVHLTPPGRLHPHPWLLVTWVEGAMLEELPLAERGELVDRLATALPALHRPAPPEAPVNPFRGPDLRDIAPPREPVVTAARRRLGGKVVAGLLSVLDEGLAAPPWPGDRVWCHGDLHPRNLLRTPDGGLGVIDLGDVTAGDPAVDLGVLWTTSPEEQRRRCVATLSPAYDGHVWTRARGWAARFVLAVAGNAPEHFGATLRHAVVQLL
jgi:aminoglycoside phosphotransferase (APT) family kinase protein